MKYNFYRKYRSKHYNSICPIPYRTEKTVRLAQDGTYTFLVHNATTSDSLVMYFRQFMHIPVESVNFINVCGKVKGKFRGRVGVRKDRKKAMVKFKKGFNIESTEFAWS